MTSDLRPHITSVCAICGRYAMPGRDEVTHQLVFHHRYVHAEPCPHGRLPVHCDECSDALEEQRIRAEWDDVRDAHWGPEPRRR